MTAQAVNADCGEDRARCARSARAMVRHGLTLVIVGLAACSASGDAPPGAIDAHADADSTRDACLAAQSCNPVFQTGCSAGERCTFALDADGARLRSACEYARCVPQGTIDVGAPCAIVPDDVDDCIGGAVCLGSVCRRYCDVAPDSCELATGERCQALPVHDAGVDRIGGCVPADAGLDAGAR